MLLLCTTHSRFIGSWKNSSRKKLRHSIPWANKTLWISDILSSNFHKRQKQASSIQLESLQWYFYWTCLERGERLDGRPTRGRCRRTERQHCNRFHVKKNQRKRRSRNSQNFWNKAHFPSVNGSLKSAADGPNRHTTNPSRSYSTLVEVISESRRRR